MFVTPQTLTKKIKYHMKILHGRHDCDMYILQVLYFLNLISLNYI